MAKTLRTSGNYTIKAGTGSGGSHTIDLDSSNVRIRGNLNIDGTQTVINSTTLSIEDKFLFSSLFKNSDLKSANIKQIMQKPFPVVHFNTSIKEVSEQIGKDTPAVLVMDLGGNWHIINQFDVIQSVE